MIAKEIQDEVKQKVEKILEHSQNIANPKVDKLIEDWATNKEDIFQAFGDKMIYEIGKIEVHLDDKAKNDKFENFITGLESEWSSSYNLPFANFLREQREGFFENRIVKEWEVKEGNVLKPGMKLSKSFKFFLDDKDEIDKWQTKASMAIQENKVYGTLCMSIHPLDFLSMSENNSNWRSCHALDGEFRAGITSYIADMATIICYIRSDEQCCLTNFPCDIKWNNKKWRLLMERSESGNFLAIGRQYPMSIDESVLNRLKDTYSMLFERNAFSNWHMDQITSYDYEKHNEDGGDLRYTYIPIRGALYKLDEIVKDCEDPLHYNDLLKSTCAKPMFAWALRARTKPLFKIGHPVNCICCGVNPITDAGGEHMLCDECAEEEYCECSCCGSHYPGDELIWVEGEQEYVCENCFEDYYGVCDNCCDYYYQDYMYYDEESDQYLCEHCYNELQEQRAKALDEDKQNKN